MSEKSSMRTPLGKVRGLGTGKGATSVFWAERLSGAAMLPLTIAFVMIVLALRGSTFEEAVATVSNPFVAILLVAAIGAAAWHMKLGMQVIIEDYVHGETARILSVMGNTFFSALVGLAGIFAVLKIAFGG
jgi:succinate dehydrogenase / fumarate reductase membrane anchor subunit